MRSPRKGREKGDGIPVVLVTDVVVTLVVVLSGATALLALALVKAAPLSDHVGRVCGQAAKQGRELLRLNALFPVYDARELDRRVSGLPVPVDPAETDAVRRLVQAAERSGPAVEALERFDGMHRELRRQALVELVRSLDAFRARVNQEMGAGDPHGLQGPPAPLPEEPEQVLRLASTSVELGAGDWERRVADWAGRLNGLIGRQSRFADHLLEGLCAEAPPLAAVVAGPGGTLSRKLADLQALDARREELWRLFLACQEPRTVIIDEELLHFQVDRSDAFESDPGPGLEKILRHVEENVGTRGQLHVMGHTDDTATHAHNDALSYRRALFVANRIREHLGAMGLSEGRDFDIHPEGLGEFRLLEREPGEPVERWRKRCRRIELLFRTDIRRMRVEREAPSVGRN